ncbi:MAG: hypothetical protein AAF989_07810 [Planctomycetota bacterium]
MKTFALTALLWLAACQAGWAQRKVILDTDPSSDPDDVGCMAMLHSMASRGECEILAVINSIDHKQGPLSISAINGFYGRNAIPVGDFKGYEHTKDAPGDLYSFMLAKEYDRSLQSHSDAIDSVSLYREILASADTKSITIIVIGTMHNLDALLRSEACVHSSLDGKDLVREKVQMVVTMGGNFIDGKGLDRTNWGGADELCGYTEWSCLNPERNRMCRFVIENCGAPFVASGWEVGCGDYHDAEQGNVMTGQELKSLAPEHIVRRSYEYHFSTRGGSERIDRHSNDQCALHYAIRGEETNYKAYLNGDIDLSETGVCRWSPTPNRGQGYIQKNRESEAIAQEIEALMLGEVIDVTSTPTAPTQVSHEMTGDQSLRLRWKAATDPHIGNWVVAYRIYRNDQPVGMAYGTQFMDTLELDQPRQRVTYRIDAINASGAQSAGPEVQVALRGP